MHIKLLIEKQEWKRWRKKKKRNETKRMVSSECEKRVIVEW